MFEPNIGIETTILLKKSETYAKEKRERTKIFTISKKYQKKFSVTTDMWIISFHKLHLTVDFSKK